MLTISTFPVYSKLATTVLPPEVAQRLPSGWRLSEHQLETYEALTGGQYDVVINTAMTGDGKSLAAYLPALASGVNLMALYPTNELARDQELQLESTRDKWRARFRHARLSAARLEDLVREAGLSRKTEALEQQLANRDVILTNPDIFHYIAQFYYTRADDAPDRLFGRRLVEGFDQFIFDEFHVFEVPQVVSVVNALLLIRAVVGTAWAGSAARKRFLFLSATPDPLLTRYLERGGFDVHVVSTEGRYLHGDEPADPAIWRRILHATDIRFDAGNVETWVEAHLEDTLLPYFRSGTPTKGAIIVNSVAAAHRLAARLKPLFHTHGLTAELNTGLSSESLRRASRESDLLIGTSTVDVGVDFRINLLIFESRDAATFLQRLGRLGRHDDNGRGQRFESFQAHALVPPFVLERLSPASLTEEGRYTREELAEAIRSAYPPPARFDDYTRHWGRLQCAHVFNSLARKPVYDTYAETRRKLKSAYWETFRININQAVTDYRDLRESQRLLLDEVRSFRGGDPLQCSLINLTEPEEPVQRYGLLSLVANADLTWLEREEFAAALKVRGLQKSFDLEQPVAFFRLHGFAERRRPIVIHIAHSIGDWSADRLGRPIVLSGLTLDAYGLDWLNALNRAMSHRQVVATLCRTPAEELRRRLYLPPLFSLYDFRSALDGTSGAIALGRQALMLHVALDRRRYDCGGGSMIF